MPQTPYMQISAEAAATRKANFISEKREILATYLTTTATQPFATYSVDSFFDFLTSLLNNTENTNGVRIYFSVLKNKLALIYTATEGGKTSDITDVGVFFTYTSSNNVNEIDVDTAKEAVRIYQSEVLPNLNQTIVITEERTSDTKSLWFSKGNLQEWISAINSQINEENPQIRDIELNLGAYSENDTITPNGIFENTGTIEVSKMLTFQYYIAGAQNEEMPGIEGLNYNSGCPCPPRTCLDSLLP